MGSGSLLSNQIASILAYIESGVKTTGAFVAEQTPDIIRQLLMWKLASGIFSAIVDITVVTIFVLIFRHLKKGFDAAGSFDRDGYGWSMFGCCAIILGFSIGLLCDLMTVLQIIVAPKIYLLEYAVDFVQGLKSE